MTKQLLNEEIGRILEIMGTSQSTINESIGDDVIRNALRTLGKPIGSNANNVNALRSAFKTATKENFKLLLDTDLKIFAVTINRAVSENKSEDEIINNLKTAYGKIFDNGGNFEGYLRKRIQKRISKSTRNMPYNTADELINSSIFQREINKFGLSANQIKATKDVIRKHFKEIGLPRDVNEFNGILKGFMKDVPPKKLNLFEKWKEGMYLGATKQFGALVFSGVLGVLFLSFLIQLIDCIGDDDSEELFDTNCVTQTFSARIVGLIFSILKGVKQGASKTKNNSSKESEEGGPTPGTLEHFKKINNSPEAVEKNGRFFDEPNLTDNPDAAWVWNKDENRYE